MSPFFLSWTLRRLRHLLAVGRGVTVNVHEHCLSVHGSSAFWGVCTQQNCRVLWSPCVELFIESHTGCQHFTQPPSRAEGSSFSTSSPAQVIIRFFFFSVTILEVVKQYLVVVLICISLITNGVDCQGPAWVEPGNSKRGQSRRGKTYLFRNIKRD